MKSMKKKTRTCIKKLEMTRLYREDLEDIEEVIQMKLKPREYKLETKDYEYDKLESIPIDTEPVSEFHIQTHNPYIRIDLYPFSATIYTVDDNLNTIGALTEILEIFSKKTPKLLYWSEKVAQWLGPILFFAPILVLREIDEIRSIKHGIFLVVLVWLLATVWLIVSFRTSMYRFSLINFNFSKESPGFIKRNKDKILVGVIIGVIIALVEIFL